MNSKLEESLFKEKSFFNYLNDLRGNSNLIPLEFDYDYEPSEFDYGRFVGKKMGEETVKNFLKIISTKNNPIIIDVCCGPGWVSLMSAIRGSKVYGYDISDTAILKAIETATSYKDIIQNNGGSFEYKNHSVHEIPFLEMSNSVDIFVGWSAFHHLDQMDLFFEKMKFSLKDNGYIISVDDIGSEKINRLITWFLKFILPLKTITYKTKFINLFYYLKKIFEKEHEWHTPMEEYVGKHENAAEKIERILVKDYKIVHNYRYCAFIHYFIGDLSGPIWFKKSIFFILFNLDNLLIKSKICKGNLRFMAAQKI
jgi:SAM-dependent methyltransferase